MLTILKDGLLGKVYFLCKECECEFIADIDDCDEDWEDYSIPWIIKCPKCHTLCKSHRGKKK